MIESKLVMKDWEYLDNNIHLGYTVWKIKIIRKRPYTYRDYLIQCKRNNATTRRKPTNQSWIIFNLTKIFPKVVLGNEEQHKLERERVVTCLW